MLKSVLSNPKFTPISNFNNNNSIFFSRSVVSFNLFSVSVPPIRTPTTRIFKSHASNPSNSQSRDREVEDDIDSLVDELRVPYHWLEPSKAKEESEWLRVALHKWLDDEYCPEDTNIQISQVAAYSYRKSLTEKQTDLGEILLKMARELETISYQESFHGAFSSANAAINLISERIESIDKV